MANIKNSTEMSASLEDDSPPVTQYRKVLWNPDFLGLHLVAYV
jgi:hypothetical protein